MCQRLCPPRAGVPQVSSTDQDASFHTTRFVSPQQAPRRPTASISLALSKRRSLHAPAVPHHRSRLAAPSAGSTTAEVAPQDVLDAQQLGKWEECIKQVRAPALLLLPPPRAPPLVAPVVGGV